MAARDVGATVVLAATAPRGPLSIVSSGCEGPGGRREEALGPYRGPASQPRLQARAWKAEPGELAWRRRRLPNCSPALVVGSPDAAPRRPRSSVAQTPSTQRAAPPDRLRARPTLTGWAAGSTPPPSSRTGCQARVPELSPPPHPHHDCLVPAPSYPSPEEGSSSIPKGSPGCPSPSTPHPRGAHSLLFPKHPAIWKASDFSVEPNEGLNSRTSLCLQSRVSDPNSHVRFVGVGESVMLRAALGTREARMSPTGFPEAIASGGVGTRSVPQLRTAGGDRGSGRSVPEKLDHSHLWDIEIWGPQIFRQLARGSCDHRGFSLSLVLLLFPKLMQSLA